MSSPPGATGTYDPRVSAAVVSPTPVVTVTPDQDGPPAISPAHARRAAVGVVVFCASLPLQWQSLATVPGLGTLRWFHLGLLPMLALAAPSWRLLALVVRRSRPVPEGMVAFIACNLLTAVAWGADPSDFVQRTVYCVFGLVGGACVLVAMHDAAGRRVLVYASLVTTVVFSANFYLAMVAARVDPLATVERAVLSGDPSIIEFSLFRSSFNSSGDSDVRSNARHEIFAALVVVFAVSLVAGAVTRATRIVLVVSGVLTLALVFISQSRSNLLAVVLAVAVVGARTVVTRRIRAGTVALVVFVIGVALAAFPVVGGLVVTRLTQTQSYDSRINAFASQLTTDQIVQRLLVGGPRLEKSTHNIIGDGALRGGVVGGIGAAIIVLALVFVAVRCTRGYFRHHSTAWFGAVLALAVTLVRCFTAGGGQIQLTEWFGVGLAIAVLIRSGWGVQDPVVAVADDGGESGVGEAVPGETARTVPGPARRRARISAGPTPPPA